MWLLTAPVPVRLCIAALLGLVLGAVVNWARYALAYEPRYLSPWSRRHPRDGRGSPADFLPIIGWWVLRRKRDLLGPRFWLRPLLLEVCCAAATAAWYWWEVIEGGLLVPRAAGGAVANDPFLTAVVHLQFAQHYLLGLFMLAAATIDADEMNIPDAVTIPGTLTGLALVTALPWTLLPAGVDVQRNFLLFLHAAAPRSWPEALMPGRPTSLLVGACCFWLWCVGLMPRTWYARHGWRRALRLSWARLLRERASAYCAILGAVGTCFIAMVWWFEPLRWLGLMTSLIGLAAGGVIVWLTRIIGTWALGREAMGFGDVTLMAMIGSFVGWQPAVLIFFSAPAAAILVGGLQWLVRRESSLPYGPYLCLSTVVVTAAWSDVWRRVEAHFSVAGLIPTVMAVGFVMLFLVLAMLRSVRGRGPAAGTDEAA